MCDIINQILTGRARIMETYEKFEAFTSERISSLRMQKGVSSREMSLSIGFGAGYISRIECGNCMPSLQGIYYICEFLNISVKDFFDAEKKSPGLINLILLEINKFDYKALENLLGFVKSINN